jgi:cytochrome b6-f complex iron-sulfur subunit
MAKRLSVKEILEAARKGGPAQPAEASAAAPEVEASDAVASVDESAMAEAAVIEEPAPAHTAPPPNLPTPSTLGRPLTLKEKLAAARAGGAAQPAAPPSAPAPVAKAKAATPPPAVDEAVEAAPAAPAEAPKAVPAPAKPLGRPMTLQEKLAAARGAGATPAAPAGAAKPAAAKPAPAAAKAGAGRVLPPLEKISDPRDIAEAARQTSAKTAKDLAAKAAAAAPAKAAPAKASAKPTSAPPKPTRQLAAAAAAAGQELDRRGFFAFGILIAWIWVAWATFTMAVSAMTLMTVRFMFPNVLAEPPSTVKVGLPSNFEPEAVSERFKAEFGFWIVRSTRYNGEDIIYAIQSVCTHLGCPPNWLAAEQKFKCPCHGSGFYVSGINFEGPAPRPLERFKIALADDGQIMVDKSQKFQQELGQWSDPESFIPA